MKFKTQHITVKGTGFKLHRDGNTTWKTQGESNAVSETVVHESVAQAKALLAIYTS